MKLKLQDCANVADIFSGVAIVITLIFLILGVWENNEITRAGAYDRNMDSLNTVRALLVTDPTMAENFQAVDRGEWETLSENEQLRVRVLIEMFFGVYEKTYFAKKYGQIGESEWTRFQRQICIFNARAARNEGLTEWIRVVTTAEFFDYIQETCPPVEGLEK